MKKTIAIVGSGAVAQYVAKQFRQEPDLEIVSAVIQKGSEHIATTTFGAGVLLIYAVDQFPVPPDLVLECAGHGGLRAHGEQILASGIDMASVSSGALADEGLHRRLTAAARLGRSQFRIVSGAIGALDALSAASVGGLSTVVYRGRKPPKGWMGSPAEEKLDLENLSEAGIHFSGTARDAALAYPKNANVAASVALAGLGFDKTRVELIADPGISQNIHEVLAEGDFGSLEFRIKGSSLPGNPRSSAIAAMSVVRESLNSVSPLIV